MWVQGDADFNPELLPCSKRVNLQTTELPSLIGMGDSCVVVIARACERLTKCWGVVPILGPRSQTSNPQNSSKEYTDLRTMQVQKSHSQFEIQHILHGHQWLQSAVNGNLSSRYTLFLICEINYRSPVTNLE